MRSILEQKRLPASVGASASQGFRRALPLIETAFRQYGLPESARPSAEADLAAWFDRFCRRNPDTAPETQTLAVLSLACSFARGYRSSHAAGAPDPKSQGILRDPPAAVAQRIAAAADPKSPASRTGSRSHAWAWLRTLGR
ncbi:MAG: hypothetical protein M3R62_09700 [Acidobacteriota bacterium]|nr:hypothetical protein [Acidobacteriota bacterium]MDQ2979485.1 hypothetical protein [Acidobacteriota bacterium]